MELPRKTNYPEFLILMSNQRGRLYTFTDYPVSVIFMLAVQENT